MEPDRTQEFNERLNQWVASQGFWFQLRYSLSGQGFVSSGGYHFFRLMLRILVFILIFTGAGGLFLMKRTSTEGFRKKMESSIGVELKAQEIRLSDFQRSQGRLSINRIVALGREDTFFTDFEARNLLCRMSILDSVKKPWRVGVLRISDLNLNLRAGTTESTSMNSLWSPLYENGSDLEVDVIDIGKATVTWGFSDFTKGKIEGSRLQMRRRADGWSMQFTGGTFTQNWLRDLSIVELSLECNKDGVVVNKGSFRKNNGSAEIVSMTIQHAERPVIDGEMKLKNFPITVTLSDTAESLMEGAVSGQLKLTGSTNTSQGILMAGKIELGENDYITLRESIPLLKALCTVDSYNNYRKVSFEKGSFTIKTGAGSLNVSEVDLDAGDLMTLKGDLTARPPTEEEIKMQLDHADSDASTETALKEKQVNLIKDDQDLEQATKLFQKYVQGKKPVTIIDQYNYLQAERLIKGYKALKRLDELRFGGKLAMSLRSDIFVRVPGVQEAYPMDEATGRVHIMVPLESSLEFLTYRQARSIYEKAKR